MKSTYTIIFKQYIINISLIVTIIGLLDKLSKTIWFRFLSPVSKLWKGRYIRNVSEENTEVKQYSSKDGPYGKPEIKWYLRKHNKWLTKVLLKLNRSSILLLPFGSSGIN